jgi:pectate lyase
MKNLLFLGIFLLSLLNLKAQNYYFAAPEGFGAGTTGGGGALPVIVTTYDDLKTEITSADSGVIIISGTITIPDGGMISEVITNKTISGLPGAILVNTTQTQSGSGILYLKNGSANVIIRNLIFEGPGAYDTDGRDNLTSDGCIKLWVDHCEFQDGLDGNFDIKGNSDSITLSWCKFTYLKPPTPGGPGGADDHRFSDLVGSNSADAPADGHFSVTFQNCFWADGCRERMPRARNAELHILNCYYNTAVESSVALGLGGGDSSLTCYVENTHFARIGTVYKNYSSDGGTVSLTFSDCINGVSDVGVVAQPTYDYSVLPVDEVAAYIPNETCGAGATLQVTSEGEISTLCDGSALYTLTTSTSGNGVGTVEISPAGSEYLPGTIVQLTAIAGTSSEFNGWSAGATGTTNPISLTIISDTTVIADFIAPTGILKISPLEVTCYPTWIDHSLYIDFSETVTGNVCITIYSVDGQKVYALSNSIAAGKMELDLNQLAGGMYFCNIQINLMEKTLRIIKN